MSLTPTQLSCKHLRDNGWTLEVVERYNQFACRRNDLFGFIDILAVRGPETLAVQTTTYPNVPSRVNKIADSEHVAAIREAGWTIHVHGWTKEHGRWILKRVVNVS